jgi:hypothetical protein
MKDDTGTWFCYERFEYKLGVWREAWKDKVLVFDGMLVT